MEEQKEVKIEIDLEPLRKRCLFIATPAYAGGMGSMYVRSLLDLQRTLMSYGIPHIIQFMYNESLISRARNKLADMFLQSDATDLMFIDADITFDPNYVVLLMHYDKDVSGGAYPLKSIEWEQVKKAVLKNPDIAPEDLSKAGARWSAHCKPGEITFRALEPLSVKELATGFMMIKRKVFETLEPTVPHYTPAVNDPGSRVPMYDFFQVGVHDDVYESEDYSFCRLWREAGGEIWLCPWMKLNHSGFYEFPGDMLAGINAAGEVK